MATSTAAVFKNEFKKNKLGLDYPNEACFCRTQWDGIPQIVFLVYRVFISTYVWGWLIFSIVKTPVFPLPPKYGHVWPAFLTNWSYTVLALYLLWAAVVAVYMGTQDSVNALLEKPSPFPIQNNTEEQPPNDTPFGEPRMVQSNTNSLLPWYLKVQWGLFAIIANVAFIITLIYFLFLFPQIYEKYGLRPVDFHIHGFNSIVIVFEMFVAAYPVRLLHIIYPVLYGLSYVLFSLFYWASDHENHVVYKGLLDWNVPGQTIVVILVLAVVVMPLLQLMLFGIYHLRTWLYLRFQRPTTVDAYA